MDPLEEVRLEEVRKGGQVEGHQGSHSPRGRQGKEASSEEAHTANLLAGVHMMMGEGIRRQAPHPGTMAAGRKGV